MSFMAGLASAIPMLMVVLMAFAATEKSLASTCRLSRSATRVHSPFKNAPGSNTLRKFTPYASRFSIRSSSYQIERFARRPTFVPTSPPDRMGKPLRAGECIMQFVSQSNVPPIFDGIFI